MTDIKAETFDREELTELMVAVAEFINNHRQWPGRKKFEDLSDKLGRAIGVTYRDSGRLEDVGKWFRRDNADIKAVDDR